MSFNEYEQREHKEMRKEVEGNFLVIDNDGYVSEGEIHNTLKSAIEDAKRNKDEISYIVRISVEELHVSGPFSLAYRRKELKI